MHETKSTTGFSKTERTRVFSIATLQPLHQNDLTQGSKPGAAKVLGHMQHLHRHVRPCPRIQPVLVDIVHERAQGLLHSPKVVSTAAPV